VVPFLAARVSDLGPGDCVQVARGGASDGSELTTASVGPDEKVQDLGSRTRCRECDEKGRAVISIRWAVSISSVRHETADGAELCRTWTVLTGLLELSANPPPNRSTRQLCRAHRARGSAAVVQDRAQASRRQP
jgi:hypothetical protein